MNYLLDTHVFLWTLADPRRLSARAAAAIRDPRHAVFVSAVSGVEISIKRRLGKLDAPDELEPEITARGLQELPLRFRHTQRLLRLPPHHQDPFDRMLLAQALEEGLTLITHDTKLQRYQVPLLLT